MKPTIKFSDFEKLDLRVAKIIEAEPVPETDKLLKLTISLGEESRTLVAGIKQHYSRDELIGKSIIIIANLEPRKLKGIESQGMLLAASDDKNTLTLLTTDKEIKEGAKIS